MRMSVADLLAPARLAELADRIGQSPRAPASPGEATPDVSAPGVSAPGASGDTVAIVTADTDGRAVCLIFSVFYLLGSGVLEPSTGILLHNRGSAFSLSPESANRIGPRKRPAHTLMPVVVSRDGRLEWVVGTMGGTRQPQIQAQLLLRLLAGATPAAALAAPRWVVEGTVEHPVAYVERPMPALAAASIGASLPVQWQGPEDEMTGRSQIARIAGDGGVTAASDPRGEGSARVAEPSTEP
jgi:gamma-glutamyltranspeptidase/glutathione hydrolase